jgi:hypothetical protein
MGDRSEQRGTKWRLLAHRDGVNVEIEDQGAFDELVVDDWLHVEQMDPSVWWLRVGDLRLIVAFDASGQPAVDVERGFYAPPKGANKKGEGSPAEGRNK